MAGWCRIILAAMVYGALTYTSSETNENDNLRSLRNLSWISLRVGSVLPAGWLKRQLEVQADGLSGHLALFWRDIAASIWQGGPYSEGDNLNEDLPYWLNGFVPLALQLQSSRPDLLRQAHDMVELILEGQSEDGWFGPRDRPVTDGDRYWRNYPLLLALTQYAEGTSLSNATASRRVANAVMQYLRYQAKAIKTTPLDVWSKYRWQDFALTVYWMLDNHCLSEADEQFLLSLSALVRHQGFDWKSFYNSSRFPREAVCQPDCGPLENHGVNNGQALKEGAVRYRATHSSQDEASSYNRVEMLDAFHGTASGIFTCDEHLAGLHPSHGTELCTVVEAQYSYAVMFSVHGDPSFAERAEMLAYNALPAELSADMWSHPYIKQPNQIAAEHEDDHFWLSDGPDATVYGLEPNFPCCTGNFNQGWPKFVSNMAFVSHPISGLSKLVLAMLGPCIITTDQIGQLSLNVTTEYPFGEAMSIVAESTRDFLLCIRIPSWADGATINSSTAKAGDLHEVYCPAGRCFVQAMFPMHVRISRRYNNAVSVYHGALLYSLDIETVSTKQPLCPGQVDLERSQMNSWINASVPKCVNHKYTMDKHGYTMAAASPWNYGLVLKNESSSEHDDVSNDFIFRRRELPLSMDHMPFSRDAMPVEIEAIGRELPSWGTVKGSADAPPFSPVHSSSPPVKLRLVPYASTHGVSMVELPTCASSHEEWV